MSFKVERGGTSTFMSATSKIDRRAQVERGRANARLFQPRRRGRISPGVRSISRFRPPRELLRYPVTPRHYDRIARGSKDE